MRTKALGGCKVKPGGEKADSRGMETPGSVKTNMNEAAEQEA